jgi:hypothetical protein
MQDTVVSTLSSKVILTPLENIISEAHCEVKYLAQGANIKISCKPVNAC